MTHKQETLKLIRAHQALDPFNYKIAVDWATELIREGKETDNILILASFSEPLEKQEIRPYVTAVLDDLGIKEIPCTDEVIAKTHFQLLKILKDTDIRNSLGLLSQICVANDFDPRIMNFYLLHHAWNELEEIGANFYFDGADLDNIGSILKKEAEKWIDRYIHGKEDPENS